MTPALDDDGTAAGGHDNRYRRFGAPKRACHIDVKHARELVLGQLGYRLSDLNAGIVDEAVEAPELCDGGSRLRPVTPKCRVRVVPKGQRVRQLRWRRWLSASAAAWAPHIPCAPGPGGVAAEQMYIPGIPSRYGFSVADRCDDVRPGAECDRRHPR